MGGVKENITEPDVKAYFSSYGNVESVELLTDKQTGKKRGFGFVNFDDYDVVDKVLYSLHFIQYNLYVQDCTNATAYNQRCFD